MSQGKKYPNRYLVNIDPDISQELMNRGEVVRQEDGRVAGISRAINKSLKNYLERI